MTLSRESDWLTRLNLAGGPGVVNLRSTKCGYTGGVVLDRPGVGIRWTPPGGQRDAAVQELGAALEEHGYERVAKSTYSTEPGSQTYRRAISGGASIELVLAPDKAHRLALQSRLAWRWFPTTAAEVGARRPTCRSGAPTAPP